MTTQSLVFDAVEEPDPGLKWQARWQRSWPAYRAWFIGRGGENGPSLQECEAAMARCMPELVPVHRRLTQLAGGGELEARFLSTWCPPAYLGGCSIAALAAGKDVRLVRNYDLSPDLNEGLLLRTEWTGLPVMGMIEFLWGLSDGINAAGLSVALAFGGSKRIARGFGVTTILRYVLETCGTVAQGLKILRSVPSHMAYNVTLADRHGASATAELLPGGGARILQPAIATNHQHGSVAADRPGFTRTHERRDHLERLLASGIAPDALGEAFLVSPLFQKNYNEGFGTLFTAVYDPASCGLTLRWPGQDWHQTLDSFAEGRREVNYRGGHQGWEDFRQLPAADPVAALAAVRPYLSPAAGRAFDHWAAKSRVGEPDWADFGRIFWR